jgi:gliding motility-associated lipoprotein GldD
MSRKHIAGLSGIIVLIAWSVAGCGGDDLLIPKPPAYLRTDFPEHTYKRTSLDCPYSFELAEAYNYNPVLEQGKPTCHLDINLGKLNGIVNFSYIEMEYPLKDYIDYALAKVEEHKVKADEIDDSQIIRPDAKVYGTFFELKGEVASPFQFYLTDSSTRFVSGVVYFNARPNYDSLRPSLDYLKKDLLHLMNTFQWEK